MSANGKYALCLLGGLFAGIALDMVAIVILMAAALFTQGYGGESVATFILPFGAVAMRLVPSLDGNYALWWLQALPFPIYGLVLGHALARKKFWWIALAVVAVHLLAWLGASSLGGYPPDHQHHMC
jgi:hypothetical protein